MNGKQKEINTIMNSIRFRENELRFYKDLKNKTNKEDINNNDLVKVNELLDKIVLDLVCDYAKLQIAKNNFHNIDINTISVDLKWDFKNE